MSLLEIVVALAILVGIAGIIVPILPGVLLIVGALLVWAIQIGGSTAWTVFGVATGLLVIGQVVKYLVPGRQLKAAVPNRTLLIGALGAVIGFFVIPVVGVLVGFPLGVYVAERVRLGGATANASTRRALRAVGLSILIELISAVLATGVWIVGILTTAS